MAKKNRRDLSDLSIDKNDLDRELVEQSTMFGLAANELALAKSRLDEAKEHLARMDSTLSLSFREQHENAGEKFTESRLSTEVSDDADHIKASDKHLKAMQDYNEALATKDAWHQRAYMLRELCGLFVAEYWERGAVRSKSVSEVEERATKERRSKINAKRRNKL